MRTRYWLVLAVFVAGVTIVLLVRPRTSSGAPGVPQAALDAMRDGRNLRASQIIRAYLKGAQDTTAETIVLLARADAGWGDWREVERLLANRPWLDRLENGIGRELLGRSELAMGNWAGAAVNLGRYLDVVEGVSDRDRGLALVRQAQALDRQGREQDATVAYDRAAHWLRPVADWLGLLAAGPAADAGDTAQVRARLAGLPAALAADRGWRLSVRAATRARDTTLALRIALAAARTLPSAADRAGAWQSAGELLRRRGQVAAAREAFARALAGAPGSASGAAAARALLALGGVSREQQLRAALALLRSDPSAAGRAIRAYVAGRGVTRARRSRLLYILGSAYFDAERYADAVAMLRASLAGASPAQAARAIYTIGRAQYRDGRSGDARSSLLRAAELYPRQAATADALFLLGDLEQDAGRLRSAAAYFARVARMRSPPAGAGTLGDAAMRLGAMAFTAGDYAGAARIYEGYRRRFPTGANQEQATYWAGRAYSRLGRADPARARFEALRGSGSLSFYALRAAERLGSPLPALQTGDAPTPSSAAREEVARGAARIDLLHQIGLDDAARQEARALQQRVGTSDAALYDLAETLVARGLTSEGVRIGWSLQRRAGTWNTRLLRIVYPFPYREAVMAEARARKLDPYLVAGLIRQESGFDAAARSRVGAIGLMQVMPGTGRSLARALGIQRFDAPLLERPEVNLQLGTSFVADLMRRANGRVAEMLAAYNAGPARLDAWRRLPEARDPELFAERIPFDETREYVKIVQANARIYAALYPELRVASAGGTR